MSNADLRPFIAEAVRRIEARKDPSFAELLEALTEECQNSCGGSGVYLNPHDPDGDNLHCTHAPAKGRHVRDVEALDGARLLDAMTVIGTPLLAEMGVNQAAAWFGDADDPLFKGEGATLKEAALRALLTALPEVKADA